MNERIKQMAEQAKQSALDAMIKITDKEQALKVYSESYDTEFAQLIVRECRDIVGKTRDQAIEGEWNVDEAMSTAMFDIEDYFGIIKTPLRA
jgi:hypothetical protein